MQKGFAPILLLVGVLILAVVGGGAYFLGKSAITKSQSPTVVSQSPQSTLAPSQNAEKITEWKTFTTSKCGFNINYPQDWEASEVDSISGLNDPKYHFGCVEIKAPDYKTYPQSDVRDGLPILITRTKQGAIFKPVVVNSVEDYIKATESVAEPPVKITNLKQEQYGDIKGTYYEQSLMEVRSSFVFMKGEYIYEISWPTDYKGTYKGEIIPILSTFRFDSLP